MRLRDYLGTKRADILAIAHRYGVSNEAEPDMLPETIRDRTLQEAIAL